MAEEFAGARKEIRVDVSRTIGLAYLPGFFHANLDRMPQIGYRVTYQASDQILTALEANEPDIGVLFPPGRLPPGRLAALLPDMQVEKKDAESDRPLGGFGTQRGRPGFCQLSIDLIK